MKDCIVIIPAFNEEKSISLVINEIPKTRVIEIIVVDNGSTDKTKEMALKAGALVVSEPCKGYGKACLRGMSFGKMFKPQYVIFLDGDYSDYPAEMENLLKYLDSGYDLVLGSRMRKFSHKLPAHSRYGNWLASKLMKIFFGGFTFTDLGPFRGIEYQALESLQMSDSNFGWTIEMQVKANIKKLKIKEIAVQYRERIGTSKISGTVKGSLFAGLKIIWIIISLVSKKNRIFPKN